MKLLTGKLAPFVPPAMAAFFLLTYYVAVESTLYSGENGFILYTLSGSFGETPTSFVHYNHIVHPFISKPVSFLFTLLPDVNWYTIAMIATHFISLVILYRCFLNKFRSIETILLLTIILFLFGNYLFRYLEFSNCSMVLAISVSVYFMNSAQDNKSPINWVFVFGLLFASFWRIHVLIPIIGLLTPFAWSMGHQVARSWILSLLVATILIFFSMQIQQWMYSKQDSAWKSEETYRSYVYQHINHPTSVQFGKNHDLFLAKQLLQNGLYIDREFLSVNKIKSVSKSKAFLTDRPRSKTIHKLKWLFINNKIYILCFVGIALLAIVLAKIRVPIAGALLLFAMGFVYLWYFAKVPSYLIPSAFFAISLASAWRTALSLGETNFPVKRILVIPLILFFVWGCIRMVKDNHSVSLNQEKFNRLQRLINSNSNSLYIVIPNNYIQHFNPFRTPVKYKLRNYVDSESWLNQTAMTKLLNFGIHSLNEIPSHENVLFIGNDPEPLLTYYNQVLNMPVEAIYMADEPDLQVFRIVPK